MTEREKQLDKMNDKLAERNGVLILENMGLKAQVKNFKFDRDNLNAKIKALQSENESLLNIIGNYEKVRKRMNKIVELTDSELTEIS